ncbi:DNA (cytosine-5)-methyltransferase 1-like [Amaranthus tricolor]|uniref:DNA (cytosine-5)-methyltransferase 1-like n=1 Tax=Amaranthus tricolor TaxID=29722 RepID=UPI002586587B|nr:DNA (cytosine-5)-methyltransferase 1-like [Amaranthus tricolor]XP_057544801.1 DNA (cytosine-5)-methyltransferase 1-like [Amaranthus tricolor]XP_057544802.1 DNA (cytosine-5)-methyltransferase 1-like [Amaranthus tricolor]
MFEHPDRNVVNKPEQKSKKRKVNPQDDDCHLTGNPVPVIEAKQRWPHRYLSKAKWVPKSMYNIEWSGEDILQANSHYTEALVDGVTIKLNEDVYIAAEEGKPNYIAKIVEFFETVDKEQFLTAQWFYRAEDTVIKNHHQLIDQRRVFLSDIKDDNPLGCILNKVKINTNTSNVGAAELYCDMKYELPYLTFSNLTLDEQNQGTGSDTSSTISSDHSSVDATDDVTSCAKQTKSGQEVAKLTNEMTLLDLYSGCGAMSTGLCLGATLAGVKLTNKWAVDLNEDACESLRRNHPETEVRNEMAEEFLSLLKEWEKLCNNMVLSVPPPPPNEVTHLDDNTDDDSPLEPGEFEVENLLEICYVKKKGLYFKVRWKGYGPEEDTWEPIDGLSGSEERIKEFVHRGYQSKILPLPGDVDFICGGPPCQGISGFNRYRNTQDPLKDEKNHQLVVFMDIVEYLRPKYVLMENVVDILRFSEGFLGRYAVGRLVSMNYQSRMGIMAAGSYGLPQFRLRVFLWGAQTSKKLPQYPLPTHEVITRGGVPVEFQDIYVSDGKQKSTSLEKALLLEDAISDLPPVTNFEDQNERPYDGAASTDFQRYIRLKRKDMINFNGSAEVSSDCDLCDHRPLQMKEDDYQRACQIPKRKGANFRDLAGVLVDNKNKVYFDPSMERVYLPSKKPLVPDYAMQFVRGTSTKPFGRLWWDETVSTVVTRAEPHNQCVLHPEQDRVLTIRENARLQGFLDCYKLYGPVKERYIQVGNAVAVPVAIALGYAFGQANQGLVDDNPLTTLPFKFPQCLARHQDLEL